MTNLTRHINSLITWVLVADDEQAEISACIKTRHNVSLRGGAHHQFYEEKFGYELDAIPGGLLKSESIDAYQVGHDRRGSSSADSSPNHNTYEPEGDINREITRHYMQSIADKLHQSCAEKSFDRLILVGPAKILGALNEHLTADVQSHIIASVTKDLLHSSDEDILTHLQDILTDTPLD